MPTESVDVRWVLWLLVATAMTGGWLPRATAQSGGATAAEITVVLEDQFGRGIGPEALIRDGACAAMLPVPLGDDEGRAEDDRTCMWRVRSARGDPLVVTHFGPLPAYEGRGSRYLLVLDIQGRQAVTVEPSLDESQYCKPTAAAVDTASLDPVTIVVHRHVEHIRFAVSFVKKQRAGGAPVPMGDLITDVTAGSLGKPALSATHPRAEYGATVVYTLEEGWNACGTWDSRQYQVGFSRVDVDPGSELIQLDTHGVPGPEDDPPATPGRGGGNEIPGVVNVWLQEPDSPARAVAVRRLDVAIGAAGMLVSNPGMGSQVGGTLHLHAIPRHLTSRTALGVSASVGLFSGKGEKYRPVLGNDPAKYQEPRHNITWSADLRLCLTLLASRGVFFRFHLGGGGWINVPRWDPNAPSPRGPMLLGDVEAQLYAARWLFVALRAGYRLFAVRDGAFQQQFNLFGPRDYPATGERGEVTHAVQLSGSLGFRI